MIAILSLMLSNGALQRIALPPITKSMVDCAEHVFSFGQVGKISTRIQVINGTIFLPKETCCQPHDFIRCHPMHNSCKDSTCLQGFRSYRVDEWLHGLHNSLARWKKTAASVPAIEFVVYMGDMSYQNETKSRCGKLAPIFANSAVAREGNAFIAVPDYSYFEGSKPGSDLQGANWFKKIDHDKEEDKARTITFETEFITKKKLAVWRGDITKWWKTRKKRKDSTWKNLRASITDKPGNCKPDDLVDAIGFEKASKLSSDIHLRPLQSRISRNSHNYASKFMSHMEMCNGYQAMISLPGNGAWSVGTKYALACNSVTIMPEQNAKSVFGMKELKPFVHFLPLSGNASTACNEVKKHVRWIKEHQHEASLMAFRSRKKAQKMLAEESVYENIIEALQLYAEAQEFEPSLDSNAMMEWVPSVEWLQLNNDNGCYAGHGHKKTSCLCSRNS